MAKTLHECVANVLRQEPEKVHRAKDIADKLLAFDDDYMKAKWERFQRKGKTKKQFKTQIINEIFSQKNAVCQRHSDIVVNMEVRPFQFYAQRQKDV